MKAEPRLKRLASSIVFIEQPIKRQNAPPADISALARKKPVIIDESDDSLDAFRARKALGYRGVSSKTCKGLYKSLINAARCKAWGEGYFMTGEDLTIQAGHRAAAGPRAGLAARADARRAQRPPLRQRHGLDCHDFSSRSRSIIDESDDSLDAFPRARRWVQGVSSKTCKGLTSR